MSVLDFYRDEVRVPVSRSVAARGYSGSHDDWHLRGASGDHGMVGVQRNRLSDDRLAFRVHLAVTPGPWWDYLRIQVPPRTTNGLWRQVLAPTTDHVDHRGERWWLIDDRDSARRCAHDVLRGLTEHGLDEVEHLLTRPGLLATLERGDLGRRRPYPHVLQIELLLLHADEGDTAGVARTAAELRAAEPRYERFVEWAEHRLQLRTAGTASPQV